ncbi:hypothetical protein NDU88_006407 [Pleurodeles waltl]|uniref:Uncharacterized protein n=1 Tax=Pleurodeles waltl TaxID=8319 RepID=A0AAV7QHJ2_PLEWA|nr:hypothetical protein NDU88_006407 [Pleurodeles waltl]
MLAEGSDLLSQSVELASRYALENAFCEENVQAKLEIGLVVLTLDRVFSHPRRPRRVLVATLRTAFARSSQVFPLVSTLLHIPQHATPRALHFSTAQRFLTRQLLSLRLRKRWVSGDPHANFPSHTTSYANMNTPACRTSQLQTVVHCPTPTILDNHLF